MEAGSSRNEEVIAPELYFLIAKFLTAGPCQDAAKVLKEELERIKILPQRLDWEGNLHNQSFEELERKYSHIGTQHLLKICARIGPVLEKEIPPCINGAISLLGAGKQSLLRTKADLLQTSRGISLYSGRISGKSFIGIPNLSLAHNVVKVLQGRENAGPLSRHEVIQPSFYSKLQLYRHTLGHLSAVYCVLYDRTGKYVITGADDLLVKVWSSSDGRLLATFRGASAEIMDIAVNFDNTLLAAGSLDKVLRVWCFQTMSPVAVLSGHSGMITSVKFCPISSNDIYYLVSTSSDGSVAFWPHTKKMNERAVFQPKPIQYHEKMRPGQAQMICASFSSGGAFMAAGSADHHVRVYAMIGDEGPRRVLEVEAHSDTVDSIQWCHHHGLRFISGSKDGTANVWHFEQQQWMHKRLVMTTKLPGEPEVDEETTKKAKVTMVNWDSSDEFVITAVNDSSLKVWNARTAELVKVLRGHKDEVFVLESHPIDPRIILSAGHDGQLIIWDVLKADPIACFQNFIQGQGNGAVFDAKWSPDGTMLAATDSHGHLMMYGFGAGVELLKIVPKELFFHTDYRPLIRDSNNYVLDEQTQTAPHLMPPPFLVDVDGNPYPPNLQRLVPGRENCRGEQLVPNIAVGVSGMQEVIEGLPGHEPRSNIDRLIEALAQRQNINVEGENADDNQGEAPLRQISSPRGNRPGLRRVGDVEGVRQSSGNWQRDNTTPWNKPILVKPLNPAILQTQLNQINAMAEMELETWRREMQRRPKIVSTGNEMQGGIGNRLNRNKRNRARHGYRTRAAREDEQDEEDYDDPDAVATSNTSASSNSNDSSADEADICSDSSSSNPSSEYSDWMADHGVNLEPPKRSKRKPVKKRSVTPQSDTDRRRSQRPKKKIVLPVSNGLDEVPEAYRPTEWLTAVIPRKAPYYPQMGDEIVYFRQGHKFYIDAVKKKKVYELGPKCEPWSKMNIKAMEYVKVVGIKYEIRPPRLCCLKLAIMNEDGRLTGENFTIKYHDMADVLDFLVLRQTFETALARSWSLGDRFRCMIDDGWWMGQIQSMEPLDENFTDSYFMCFHVRWDNGEIEKMSPWDLEPIDECRLPDVIGGAVPVLPEEIQAILYQPQAEEWPMGDREATCRRIIRGLDQVMSLAIAEPFVVPVDLNIYPSYAFVVEYPIDLSTIKARFENHFYRRITSAQFDVRYLATNAEEFNEPHSHIVKQARIVTDLCLKIIKDTTELDVAAVYHQLVDTYHSSESDIDVEENSEKPSTSRLRSSSSKRLRSQTFAQDWKTACRQLLETLWQCEDSVPFREPVDRLEHADYYQIIDTPMDLRTVKEDLSGGNYETPAEFAKDVKLIFTNSRTYNTNKRSKIYTMTIRLSLMFEELMCKVLSSWNSEKRRILKDKRKPKGKSKAKGKGKAIAKAKGSKRLTNGAGPSRESDSSDENDANVANYAYDDDDDDDDDSTRVDGPGPSRLANGHAKRAGTSSRSNIKLRSPRKTSPKKNKMNYGEMSDSEISESESSNSEPVRRTRSMKAMASDANDSDSEESYKPGGRGKQTKKNRAKNNRIKVIKPKQKQPIVEDDDEDDHEGDDDDEEEEEEEEQEMAEEEEENNEEETATFSLNQRIFVSQSSEESENEEVIRRTSSRACKVVNKIVNQSTSNDNSISESAEEEEEEEEEQNNASNDPQDSDSQDIGSPVKSTRSQTRSQMSQDSDSQDGTQSSRRRGKRPHYNEDSEDSNGDPVRNRRSVKRRYYAEESDESVPENRNGITISSRGRVRKMTARARAYLLEPP